MNNDILFSVFNIVFILIIKIISTDNNEPKMLKRLHVSNNMDCLKHGHQFGSVI